MTFKAIDLGYVYAGSHSRLLGRCTHTRCVLPPPPTSYMHTRDTHTGHSLHPTVQDSANPTVQYRPSWLSRLDSVAAAVWSPAETSLSRCTLYTYTVHQTVQSGLLVDLSEGISVRILLALVTLETEKPFNSILTSGYLLSGVTVL